MQVEGSVLNLEIVFFAQFVDPRLADVAERSDKVAVDDELGGHWAASFSL